MSSNSTFALVVDGKKLLKRSIPRPVPGPHELLVRVSHVPRIQQMALDESAFGDGAVLGCDFVGTVVQVGGAVTRVETGTVIAGLIHGAQSETIGVGGFSEYTIADEDICFPPPPEISPKEAATVPLAACTAFLAIFSNNSLDIDENSRETLLLWGGTSSVGLYAIQIAKPYGLRVVTACSARHYDLVRSLGADEVFDYHDDDVIHKIRKATDGKLTYAFDTIGNETSSVTVSHALSEQGGTLCTVRPGNPFAGNVTKQTKVTDVLVWTVFHKEHKYNDLIYPVNEAHHKLAADLFARLPKWLANGNIKPNSIKLMVGLDQVSAGFQEFRDGKISNYKIVYQI